MPMPVPPRTAAVPEKSSNGFLEVPNPRSSTAGKKKIERKTSRSPSPETAVLAASQKPMRASRRKMSAGGRGEPSYDYDAKRSETYRPSR